MKTLGGGIPVRSLTLIEGAQSAGKSVLCQHFTYGALLDGLGVAYFTPDHDAGSLIKQMNSIGLDVADYFQQSKLGIYPVQEPGKGEDAEELMDSLAEEVERHAGQHDFIIVDSITNLVTRSSDNAIIRLFSSVMGLCKNGKTSILVARSYVFDQRMLARFQSLCDAHFNLREEATGGRSVKMLEVCKVHNAVSRSRNVMGFDVKPGTGLEFLPVRQLRV